MNVLILGPTLMLCCSSAAMAADWFVDDSIPTSGIGASWSTAKKTFGEALSAASDGDNIFVGGGTYKHGTTRSSTFTLKQCIIKGGYAGYGAGDPWLINSTSILSGDIGTANDYSDNCYHVVTANDGDMTKDNTQLINFTSTKGNGDGSGVDAGGGGMRIIDGADLRIDGCIIVDNRVDNTEGVTLEDPEETEYDAPISAYGAGALCYDASPVFTRCVFSGNIATSNNLIYGGGVCVQGESAEVRLIDCRLTGNQAVRGGGIAVKNSGTIAITNCLLDGNSASREGGGVSIDRLGIMTIVNCSIAGNAASRGGGIAQFGNSSNAMTMVNSIVWANTASSSDPGLYLALSPGATTITYSDVQGTSTFTGTGNINADPNFVGGGNYQLACYSPCINAGNPTVTGVIPADEFNLDGDGSTTEPTPDLLLVNRVQGNPANPDMGSYEKAYAMVACPGEANADGCVGVADLLAVISTWGACGSPCPTDIMPQPATTDR